MTVIVLTIHIVVTLLLIGSILVSRGMGANAGAAFGSASPKNLFSNQKTSNKNVRFNALLAILFLLTSMVLAILSKDTKTNLSSQLEQESVLVPGIEQTQDPSDPFK